MYISISEENKILYQTVLEELDKIKQEALGLSVSLLIALKNRLWNFILSYGEYSPQNIREHGLEAILLRRAVRFFNLEDLAGERVGRRKRKSSRKNPFGRKETNKRTRISSKLLVKKALYPIYWLILGLQVVVKGKGGSKRYKGNVFKE